jgi:predicted DNA-binding protein
LRGPGWVSVRAAVTIERKVKKRQVSLYLTEDQLRRVDDVVRVTGATKNAVMREIVEKGLPAVEREYGITSPP